MRRKSAVLGILILALIALGGVLWRDPVIRDSLLRTANRRHEQASYLRMLREKAEQGQMEEQYLLGYLYYTEDGVKQDYAEAAAWFRKAAAQGQQRAQSQLAEMYDQGIGVKQDYAEAVAWHREAGEFWELARHYAIGLGVQRDRLQARWWCIKNESIQDGIGDYTGECRHRLGDMFYSGDGVGQDYAEALRWYREAAAEWSYAVRPRAQEAISSLRKKAPGLMLDSREGEDEEEEGDGEEPRKEQRKPTPQARPEGESPRS